MKLNEFKRGEQFQTRSVKLTKDAIMKFAAEFDPQYMHLDEEKAKQGRYKGIIASGMQTMNVSFKLWIELGLYGDDIIAGTGMNNLRYIRPVYPDDELHVVVEVIDIIEKNNEQGIVTVRMTTYNQAGKKVFTCDLSALMMQ